MSDTEAPQKTLKELIRDRMKAQGLTSIRQLEKAVGVSTGTLSRYMAKPKKDQKRSKAYRLQIRTIKRIAIWLDKPFNEVADLAQWDIEDGPHRDCGTPEVALKRAMLTAGGDPTHAGFPIGVMRGRRLITEIEFRSALNFQELHRSAVGSPHAKAGMDFNKVYAPSSKAPQPHIPERFHEYFDYQELLGSYGEEIRTAVFNYVVLEHWPAFLLDPRHPKELPVENYLDYLNLLIGIKAIAVPWSEREKRAVVQPENIPISALIVESALVSTI